MTQVNLSSNQLSSLKGCHALQCTRTLLADNNTLEDLTDLQYLPDLETLSVKNNCILLMIYLKQGSVFVKITNNHLG